MVEAIIEWADTGNCFIYKVSDGKVYTEQGLYVFSEERLSLEIAKGGLILHDSEAATS